MTAVVLACTALCATTRADLTAFWRHNPITPAAIADDPALAGMQSWSAMVTNTDGLFAFAGLRAVLPGGNTFYRNPNGDSFRPTVAEQNAHPALSFHTYVTSPTQLTLNVLGGFPDPATPSFGGPLDPLPGTFSVLWAEFGGPPVHAPGTYEVARLTFPAGTLPAIHVESHVSYTDRTAMIPTTIPEPASALAVVLMALLLMTMNPRELQL